MSASLTVCIEVMCSRTAYACATHGPFTVGVCLQLSRDSHGQTRRKGVDVAGWLRELGLERYGQASRDNEIDPESCSISARPTLKRSGCRSARARSCWL